MNAPRMLRIIAAAPIVETPTPIPALAPTLRPVEEAFDVGLGIDVVVGVNVVLAMFVILTDVDTVEVAAEIVVADF